MQTANMRMWCPDMLWKFQKVAGKQKKARKREHVDSKQIMLIQKERLMKQKPKD